MTGFFGKLPPTEIAMEACGEVYRRARQLIALGHTNAEIADQLYLSVRTVETHRSASMRKLDIHDTAGLVRYAIRRGVTQP